LLKSGSDLAISTDVEEEHQEIAQLMMHDLGVEDLTFNTVPFQLTAISSGNVEVSMAIKAVFKSESEIS
jgi:hypothetical protein